MPPKKRPVDSEESASDSDPDSEPEPDSEDYSSDSPPPKKPTAASKSKPKRKPAAKTANKKQKQSPLPTSSSIIRSSDRASLENLLTDLINTKATLTYNLLVERLSLKPKLEKNLVLKNAVSTITTAEKTGSFKATNDDNLIQIFSYLNVVEQLKVFNVCQCFLSFKKAPEIFTHSLHINISGRYGLPQRTFARLSSSIPTNKIVALKLNCDKTTDLYALSEFVDELDKNGQTLEVLQLKGKKFEGIQIIKKLKSLCSNLLHLKSAKVDRTMEILEVSPKLQSVDLESDDCGDIIRLAIANAKARDTNRVERFGDETRVTSTLKAITIDSRWGGSVWESDATAYSFITLIDPTVLFETAPSKLPELESLTLAGYVLRPLPNLNYSTKFDRLLNLELSYLQPNTRAYNPISAANTSKAFHDFHRVLPLVCPNLEMLKIRGANCEVGYFNSKECAGYAWPIYLPKDAFDLPKLKVLWVKGFAINTGTTLSLNVPLLEEFNFQIMYPKKSTGYQRNETEAIHEAQIKIDLAAIDTVKEDLLTNCSGVKAEKLLISIKYREDSKPYKILNWCNAELKDKSEIQLLDIVRGVVV